MFPRVAVSFVYTPHFLLFLCDSKPESNKCRMCPWDDQA